MAVATEMSAFERRSVLFLTLLYTFRMLGLFMVLPLLAVAGEQYSGATPMLMGLALGVYGLTQAMFQIPFGVGSDKWGRKPLIAFGLMLFAAGSLLAAFSDSIWGLIAGRALQGSGAIAAVIMALVGDVTAERNRSKAMASIGAAIGVAFAVSLVLGPVLAAMGGLQLLFLVTALLAVIGLLVLYFGIPQPPRMKSSPAVPLLQLLKNPALLRLSAAIFVLHFALMALFVVVPGLLLAQLDLAVIDHWKVYLPIMLLAFAAMVPAIIWAERSKAHSKVLRLAAGALLFAGALFLLASSGALALGLLAGLLLFFIGFNVFEASLPSLLTRLLSMEQRGAASGVYSSAQFIGTFLGGLMGGVLLQYLGSSAVISLLLLLALLIGAVIWHLPPLPEFETLFIDVHPQRVDEAHSILGQLPGVIEVALSEAGVASVRIDDKDFDEQQLIALKLDAPNQA